MRRLLVALLLLTLTACGGASNQPAPTDAPPTDGEPTPTFESGDEPLAGVASVSAQVRGAITGEFTQALLSVEAGKDYILLLEQEAGVNPLQLRLILAANIEPGTYSIVPAQDFQLPEGATVAARFDLGFPATDLSGEFVLDSIGENNFTGSINLTARDGGQAITVEGRFENLNAAIIG